MKVTVLCFFVLVLVAVGKTIAICSINQRITHFLSLSLFAKYGYLAWGWDSIGFPGRSATPSALPRQRTRILSTILQWGPRRIRRACAKWWYHIAHRSGHSQSIFEPTIQHLWTTRQWIWTIWWTEQRRSWPRRCGVCLSLTGALLNGKLLGSGSSFFNFKGSFQGKHAMVGIF